MIKIIGRVIFFLIYFLFFSSNITYAHLSDSDWILLPESSYSLCSGYYKPFDFSSWLSKKSPEITADYLAHQPNSTRFSGHVELYTDQQLLCTEQLILKYDANQKPQIAFAQNKVQYYRPDFYLSSKQAKYDFFNKSCKIDHAHYRFYPRHAHGQADSIDLFGKTKLTCQNGSYTTCAPRDNTWHLQTKYLHLDTVHNRGTARHVILRCKNFPIFYWPYFQFPLDNQTRLSGFLSPSYYKHPYLGYGLILPYYWNLAPNFDTTIYLKPHTQGTLQLEQEFRYLLPYLSGDLKYAVLSDHHYDIHHRKTRACLDTKHQFDSGDHWSGQFNLQRVSDPQYYNDFSTQLEQSNIRYLPCHTTVNYAQSHFKFSSHYATYQALSPLPNFPTIEVYNLKPELQFQQFETPLGYSSILGSQILQWTHFEKHTHSIQNPKTHRLIWQPRIHRRFQFPGGFFDPSLAARVSYYHISNPQSNIQKIVQACPIISFETGLNFEKYSTYQSFYSPIQTLEPKIFYCWIPKAQNKSPIQFDSYAHDIPYIPYNFQSEQFSGYDQLDTANRLTLGLTSRWIDPIQHKEWAELSISQIYDLKKHSDYSYHRSPFYLESSVSLSRHNPKLWKIYSALAWSLETHQNNYFSITSQWSLFLSDPDLKTDCLSCAVPNPDTITPVFRRYPIFIYASYTDHKASELQQAILGSVIPIHNRWRILGQCHYDLKTHHLVRILSGLEWENCCISIRLAMAGHFKPDPTGTLSPKIQSQYFLQIQFKGLTTLGQKELDSSIKKYLPGYHWIQNRY